MATTRLDRLVRFRERAEGDALVDLAAAQRDLRAAVERLEEAVAAARVDRRAPGSAALWELGEAAHRRALQAVRARQGDLGAAADRRDAASSDYRDAHQDAEAMRRAAERKRAERARAAERRETRAADELATLRFNAK